MLSEDFLSFLKKIHCKMGKNSHILDGAGNTDIVYEFNHLERYYHIIT